ncbi:aromatic ring-hydroxylating dioxygenase subunit alpha [Pseudomonas sp. FP2300]|nr:aromatic ring-hydroxylating dioxygenase subunit alpha [Pseudomonas sp. FP2300]WLH65927.1 aromatic ring-hydroxylating dioxygenase subunit alpha [Pseudomonas sp. FP2300]
MKSSTTSPIPLSTFPLDQWYVVAFSWELKEKPLARTLLGHSVVLFRPTEGKVAALEDRCCQCQCIEIPGQTKIPGKARVAAFTVRERDQIVWIWFAREPDVEPTAEPPVYDVHSSGLYLFEGDTCHYDAPYQLIHDNLLDLSHLGYVHLHTIGGDAKTHMHAKMTVESEGDTVRVVRHMLDSTPPPTYVAAYPFTCRVDRWQEVEFHVNHLRIWTGALDAGTEPLDAKDRGGFHMRGFHGVTPETESSSHYFWTIATNPKSNPEAVKQKVVEQTRLTFDEDKVVIEAQYRNMCRFPNREMIDIHVDVGANRARRILDRLRSPGNYLHNAWRKRSSTAIQYRNNRKRLS